MRVPREDIQPEMPRTWSLVLEYVRGLRASGLDADYQEWEAAMRAGVNEEETTYLSRMEYIYGEWDKEAFRRILVAAIPREELPDLRFTTAQEACDFLIARGLLHPRYAVIEEGWRVKDSRASIPGWTLTERAENGEISLSESVCNPIERLKNPTEAIEYLLKRCL
ncbi:MAG: hypothetical protein WC777_00040 [Candidatus Gracilibacteria bacterium]|jgi:hypothetical protein